MSSSKSELVSPQISEGSSVTQLISVLRCSFQQKEYDEVERLLICREEKLLMELKNLRRDFDLIKQQRDSVEKAHGISELDRLMIEEELNRCKRDYEEAREQLTKLGSDHEVLIRRVRSAEIRYKSVAEELKKVENEHRTERNKMIEELAKKNEELDELRTGRNEMTEKLISEKRDAEETVSHLRSHLQTFGGRVSILEENVAKLLDVDALHIRSFQEEDMEAEGSFLLSSAAMETSVNGGLSGGSAFEGESCGVDVKNMWSEANDHGKVHVLLRSHLPYNATATENPDLPDFGTTAANEHDIGETKGVALSTFDRPPVETNGCSQSEVHLTSPAAALTSANMSGHNEMGIQESVLEIESSSEKAASFIQVTKEPIIVEISDSEDESLAAVSSDASVLFATEVNLIGKKVPLQEENGSECLKDSRINLMLNRKRSKTDLDDMGNFKVSRRKRKDSALHDSSGSEDNNTCFVSYMEKKVAKFIRHNENTWKFAADMLSALEKDYELCMNAVCALYREKISAKKSNSNSSIPGDLAFFHFDAMRGNALAEYLIDGHPQHKLKKTVSQVLQENPNVLAQCKDLAIHYTEKLFDIYTDGRDRFFRPDL